MRVAGLMILLNASFLLLQAKLAGAAEGSLFPLDPGWTWSYAKADGYQGQAWIDGETEVQGTTVIVRRISLQDDIGGQEYENYWTVGPDGDLHLHGFTQFTNGFALSYRPPILYMKAEPVLGQSWAGTHEAFLNLEGTGDPFPATRVEFEVVFTGDTTVPAGSFEAVALVYREEPASLAASLRIDRGTYDLSGGQLPDTVAAGVDGGTFSRGIGEIRFDPGAGPYELTSYGGPVQADATTWGRLKAMYQTRNW